MIDVRIHWISARDGGRKTPVPGGWYYPIARFEDDDPHSSEGDWSVRMYLSPPVDEAGSLVSDGTCAFLVPEAPSGKFEDFDGFEIFEGPRKVGIVEILRNDKVD